MALLERVKLQKLTIKAYKERLRTTAAGSFEAMYNPASFAQTYEIEYYGKGQQAIGTSDTEAKYRLSKPRELRLNLILDGTGVQDMGVTRLAGQKSVSDRVKEFLDVSFDMNGDIHEPNFLVIEWGDRLNFSCRLAKADINYTSFNPDGSPLRAELDIILVSDEDVHLRQRKENKSSPDLTHRRVVKSGDTLPLLAKEIYGSSRYYLRVAQVNELDDFRRLTPGQELHFPPLASPESA